jgi:hypothetical protein
MPDPLRAPAGRRLRDWFLPAGVVLGLLGLSVLFQFDPSQSAFFPQCPFHYFTGLDCPGCGALRASHSLLHGHVLAAFCLNPLFCALLPLGAWFGLGGLIRRLGVGSLPNPFRHPLWTWMLLWVIVAFWVGRNIVGS